VGTAVDKILLALPGGFKLLGIPFPQLDIESRPLTAFVRDAKLYNAQRAADRAPNKNTFYDAAASMSIEECSRALATQALWMAIGAKVFAESNGTGEIALALPSSFNPEDPAAVAALLLRRYIPALEHNGFPGLWVPHPRRQEPNRNSAALFETALVKGVTSEEIEAAKNLLPDDASSSGLRFNINVVLNGVDHRLNVSPLPSLPGVSSGGGPFGSIDEDENIDEAFGKGLILFGDLDGQLRGKGGPRRGLNHGDDGIGMGLCVGVDDARKYV